MCFFSSKRRLTRCALVTGVQTCALPISTFNGAGDFGNFRGSRVPFTPTWQGSADAQYEWNAGSFKAFVGSSLNFQGASNSTFTLPDNQIGRASCMARVSQYV